MWVENLAVGLACALGCGCMTLVPETRALPPAEEDVLLPPARGQGSPLALHLEQDGDFIRARVEWAATCRRARVVYPRAETVTRSVPNRRAAVAAGMGAVGAGTAGSLLLAHRNEFSDVETCDVDSDGNETCSSPREGATAGGAVLVGTGLALVAASIVTLASKPVTTSVDVTRGSPSPPRVLEDGVSCGDGAVGGLGLALYRGDERVASATTDEQGEVGFAVPAWAGETLTLKAEYVPLGFRTLVPGQWLGTLRPESKAPASDW